MIVSYDPDGMWRVGYHILTEMKDRHTQGRVYLQGDDVEAPSKLFAGEMYRTVKRRWGTTLDDFRTRLAQTEGNLGALGWAITKAVLNAVEADQLSAESFDRPDYRREMLEELA